MRRFAGSILKVLLFDTVLAAIVIASAGRIDLPWVWALLGVQAAFMSVAMTLMDPTLFQERMRPGPGAQDGWAQRAMALLLVVHLVIVGLDVGRFHWSGAIAVPVRLSALVVFAAAAGFTFWAMVVNRFFSSVIRLQTDRGHYVITHGPYRLVRHPGYLGMLVSAFAGGVVMGSWWSLLPLVLIAPVILLRLRKEDAFLHRELVGYTTYAQAVRYKLVPGLW